MLMRNPTAPLLKRAALVATVAAFAATMAQPSMAASNTSSKAPAGISAKASAGDVTDFSSQRRRTSRGGGYGGAAAAAAFAGIVGTAIVASQANRGYGYGDPYDSYAYSPGYDAGGPGYYGGGPSYYGGGYGRDPSTFGGSTYQGNGSRW